MAMGPIRRRTCLEKTARRLIWLQGYEGINRLALDIIGKPQHGASVTAGWLSRPLSTTIVAKR